MPRMPSDFIVGRQGDSLLGKVLDRVFAIRSSLGRVRVKTEEVAWIHFANGRDVQKDEVWLKTGDRLSGSVEQGRVRFRTDGGDILEVPREAIHSIVVGGSFSRRARSLR